MTRRNGADGRRRSPTCRCCSRPRPMRPRPARWSMSSASRPMRTCRSTGTSTSGRCWSAARTTSTSGGTTPSGWRPSLAEEVPFKHRHRPAQGAAGPQWLDGPEGRRHASEGFTAPIAVRLLYNPPGVGFVGQRSPFPKARTKRSSRSPPTAARRSARGRSCVLGRSAQRRRRLDPVLVAAGRPDDRRPVLQASRSTRPRSSRARKPKSSIKVEKTPRLRGRRQGRAGRPARRSDDRADRDHQGHDRAGLQGRRRAPNRRPGKYPSLICVATFHGRTASRSRTRSAPANCGSMRRCRPSPSAPPAAAPAAAAAPMPAAAPDEAAHAAGAAAARERTSKGRSDRRPTLRWESVEVSVQRTKLDCDAERRGLRSTQSLGTRTMKYPYALLATLALAATAWAEPAITALDVYPPDVNLNTKARPAAVRRRGHARRRRHARRHRAGRGEAGRCRSSASSTRTRSTRVADGADDARRRVSGPQDRGARSP